MLISNVHTNHCDFKKPKLSEKTRGTTRFWPEPFVLAKGQRGKQRGLSCVEAGADPPSWKEETLLGTCGFASILYGRGAS